MGPDATADRRHFRRTILLATCAAVLIAAAVFWWRSAGSGPTMPTSISAEAGFARDMQVHHIQGVEMAMVVRDRTTDPDIRQLAYDVIEQMRGHRRRAGLIDLCRSGFGHFQVQVRRLEREARPLSLKQYV